MFGIVGISFTRLDDLDSEAIQVIKVVRSVGNDVSFDVKKGKVFQDGILELSLPIILVRDRIRQIASYRLLAGVSIVETNDQLSLVHFGEILIQHCSLGMSNMQVAAWLGWKRVTTSPIFAPSRPRAKPAATLVDLALLAFAAVKPARAA